ncbi:ethanolamine ammonia-lyase subunit EutC [Gordonia sp. NB41Y]|uniref:ethanolamine ammonia-lyase subunit EutC n=1 Tax=Gordonia sp. NB41Y TaxID=875808 RepID=UPI0006B1EC24|nr:ethanolamine ammonia-lyase subunit EutC [Gordonia sp. NB41Y]KOY49634.1 ethanolamine ammonia-lyase [Gordonia sp. NB41Y]WLP92386.1 ethanolamine ammonia-lyase subunit EutC [Gordonia sp. NB41Y]
MSSPEFPDPWNPLRGYTQARIGLQRSGYASSTADLLRFQADHAAARDAVHTPLDVDALTVGLRRLGLGEPAVVAGRAASRAEYLRRPDLGRLPADLGALTPPDGGADVGIVVAEGLSATAVSTHAVALTAAVVDALTPDLQVAAPVVATGARVALGDHIGEVLGVQTLLVIIGERPGLSVADSLGIYLTHLPRPGRRDSERNCISNVHPPDGLGYVQAARIVRALVDGARRLGASGVALKDTSDRTALDPMPGGTEGGDTAS